MPDLLRLSVFSICHRISDGGMNAQHPKATLDIIIQLYISILHDYWETPPLITSFELSALSYIPYLYS